jgi:putative tryptophan/tyrosine transport system substrate-binding protein
MRRREFLGMLGSAAAAWPLGARAQQAMPVIGLLSIRGPGDDPHLLAAFRQGLQEGGYVEGQNAAIEYRFAEGRYDRLPELATDLVRRKVTLIAALGSPAAPAAKAATAAIPIVFTVGVDPVEAGLVAAMNRPGGNLTGATGLGVELAPKRLELLRELVPRATIIAALLNPNGPDAEAQSRTLQSAARGFGVKFHIIHASAEHDFDTAFATLIKLGAGALVIGNDPFFISRSVQLAALTVRHAVPAIFQTPAFAAAGGLMSYASKLEDMYRQVGVYAGRILKGEKPADLPVQQSTKAELIINLKTAKALGLTVPLPLLGRADGVIE